MRHVLLLIGLAIGLTLRPAAQQDAAAFLLANTNNLRSERGLPAYALHPALSAAAESHARWMAATSQISHAQGDGSGPRERAVSAGFPSSWVSENIYLGSSAGPQAAWHWWLNSEVHRAGLVSPYYDRVGIGSARGAGQTAYVMVFGNASGSLAGNSAPDAGGSSAPAPRPFVLGRDEVGNIKHEVQPGQTLGDIALLYGYTWDDIDAMLAINGMTRADQRYLQPGSVFLVPPQDGTYTPTSEAPAATATPTATATPEPTVTSTPGPRATAPGPTAAPTREIRLRQALEPAVPNAPPSAAAVAGVTAELGLLGLAILVQVGLLAGATWHLLRRWR